MRALTARKSFIAASVLVFLGASASLASDWNVTTKTETYLCGEVDVKAFFANYDKSACIAYDWRTGTGSFTMTLGVGLGAGAGLEIGGWGARTELALGQRIEVTIEGKKTTDEIVAVCKDPGADGKMFRAQLLQAIKQELLALPETDLKKAGVSRDQIEALTELPAFDLILAEADKAKKFEELLREGEKADSN